MDTPAPGVYEDISDSEYRAMPAVGHSDLRQWISGHKATGRALTIGALLHDYVLRPQLVKGRYVGTGEQFDLRTKDGKTALALLEESTGKVAIQPSEKELVAHMVRGLRQDAKCAKALDAKRMTEVVLVAEMHGVLCKGKLDILADKFIADLKSTGCENAQSFLDSIYRFGYHSQGAFYTDLCAALHNGIHRPFLFLCTSKRVCDAWVTRLSPEQYAAGSRWVEDTLTLWKRYGGNDGDQNN